MGEPSKHAERKRPQTTGLAAADPGAQPPFLWCAPRLICLAPPTSATPLRLGGQAAITPAQPTPASTTVAPDGVRARSEEQKSDLRTLMRISYAVGSLRITTITALSRSE